MGPRVAVIVPVFSAAPSLEAAVRATPDGDELVVVDDGSTPPVQCGPARVLRMPHAGVAAARNAGVAATDASILLFLDADDEPLDRWRDLLVAPFDDPRVGYSCGSALIDGDGEGGVRVPSALGPAFADQIGLFLAGCFAVRRDVFVAAGGYDEQLAYSENAELGMRVSRFCRDHDVAMVDVGAVVLRVNARGAEQRRSQYAEARLAAVSRLFEVHGEALATDAVLARDYASVAGASAAFLGRHREARRWFGRALRARPRDPRAVGRFVLSLVPVVRDRVWRS